MGKLRKKYSNETLTLALAAVRSSRSICNVNQKFGIPRATLSSEHRGKLPTEATAGPDQYLIP